ncbi:Hpt domain-containing protein [Dechloromonas sp. TW-R-39-2]|uniref:hybrid sensor histidine kinase/response regulator n=1 Tax=Dechloromonas sp. TW-R-39-2 TaxID=2654218 RepID=UPI001EEFBF62|nr:Hpt domain-containing protein [Dechloromonas sp. TW-R-39-2]
MGPLSWVKAEIDLALERAEQALAQSAGGTDVTQLKFCRTHVHQVHGALAIVGLDGVTQISDSLELLLQGLEEGRLLADQACLTAIGQALSALRQYLDDLMLGEPNQPLRLLPVSQALKAARGMPAGHASELFYPDLSLRPPKRWAGAPTVSPDELKAALKTERMRYQKGLLSWLKKPAEAEAGRQQMRQALAGVEALQEAPAARSFWWVGLAFLDALAAPEVAADVSARQLCSHFDAQIRRLLEGSNSIAERVMREALYHVAQAPAELSPQIAQVQSTFALSALLPSAVPLAGPKPQDAALRKLREALATTEELWNRFCTGSASSLTSFVDHARVCATLTEDIGYTDLKRLGQGLGAIANWLSEAPGRHNDTVAMEVATAILLLQNAQESFHRLGTDFAQQVDLMVARLYACIAGKPMAGDQALPALDEMTRRAQERLLIGQVGKEIQSNLAQIEQALDVFFREPAKGLDFAPIDGPLKQIGGAFAMLGHFAAVNSLKACGEHIRQFAAPDQTPTHDDFEALAQQLSLLGFFVDSLQHGETDFDAFVRRQKGGAAVDPAAEAEMPHATVEAQLAEQARETRNLVEALRESPEDLNLQDELKQNLKSIQKDADLVADRELGESAKLALEALQSGGVDAALSGLPSGTLDAPPPSAATLQLAEASHADIDAELLAIFLEEANQVLETIGEQAARLVAAANDVDALTIIRRSTHTLKGSGRMVGLKDLGETAWALEQTLNHWLQQDLPVTPALHTMIADEHRLFSAWVACLESGQGALPDPAGLIAMAAQLRGASAPELPLPVESTAATSAVQQIELPVPDSATDAPSILLDLPETDILEAEAEAEADVHLQVTAEALEDLLVADEQMLQSTPEKAEIAAPPAAPTLYDIFREEARGHLQTLIDSHAALNATPDAPTTFEMTRAAHTLGGISATVGLMPLNHLAIALEHALLRRDSSAQPDSIEGLETVRQSIMMLEEMFAGLAAQKAPDEQPQLIVALDEIFLAPAVDETPEAPPQQSAQIIPLHAEMPPAAPASAPIPLAPLLNDTLDEQLLPIFLEEASDQLRDLASHLRAWRADPTLDAHPKAIARLLHTFKGNARMAGAMNLGELTHLLETRVDETLKANAPDGIPFDELEAGFDALAQTVDAFRRGAHLLAEPDADPEDDETAMPAGNPGADTEIEAAGAQYGSLRMRADLVDRLVNEAGELAIARTRIEGEMRNLKGSLLDLTENVIRLRRQLREIEIQAEGQMQARVAQEGQAEFDPLELDRFTRFQELTRFMAESVNDVATVQQNLLKNLDDANAAIIAQSRLNRSLQQELMAVRMIPFASQSERLYRIVRQTAKEVGKRANLDIADGQVDIDRSVLDKMLAPLEHMLRNAVTHGIESREQRLAAGKSEIGEITLKLAQEGNEIILTLADDGKGLDHQLIRARAEAMGLLAPDAAVDAAQLHDFIFHPGFSTAAELSQLAGRGVGMDVVKTEVTALGGRIETLSQPGAGSTFRIYLPLTLAMAQTLLVRAGAQRYAVPSTMIEQVLELKEKGLTALRENGEAEWQGNRYPFHFLPHLLGDAAAVPEAHRQYWVLLLRSGTQRVAVLVDELKGNQEVVVKNIGAQLARVVGISGATVLGDGQVVLILNPVALAARTPLATPQTTTPAEAAPVASGATLPTVMVVDDSLTVRKITSRLLLREGYQVVLAKDGVDALEKLLDVQPDVVLSDIEMPRMDGFDLLRNIRADEQYKHLPVIMITSRTADKHRNYALEIGANHYLGKPYDEDELLGLVAGYCKKAG